MDEDNGEDCGMKICYVVYREDNVMVFDSQVLEYLQKIKDYPEVEEVTLVLFRHEDHLFKKKETEEKILHFVDNCISFPSLPVLTMAQLNVNCGKLRRFAERKYRDADKVAVICRGDLAAYVGGKAFANMAQCRVLYDNRGLAFEESVMSHGDKWTHKRNREIKLRALKYARFHCDTYNFVTNSMRDYMLDKYKFKQNAPYTIIPTLYKAAPLDPNELQKIQTRENWKATDYVITYVGSTAAWQSTAQLVDIISRTSCLSDNVRFMVLTNGEIHELDALKDKLQDRLFIKGVKHSEMKYYLAMSNIGIVIRDNNIVNRVAAPTKIAEYLTNGLKILYSGDIGIITDLKYLLGKEALIEYGNGENWISTIENDIKNPQKKVSAKVVSYFDMHTRQGETLEMLNAAFDKEREVF